MSIYHELQRRIEAIKQRCELLCKELKFDTMSFETCVEFCLKKRLKELLEN